MILYKNTADQVVYTRLVSITGGVQQLISGLTSSGITGFVSKNGGTPTGLSNQVQSLGVGGIYRYLPTQNDTNCDVGVFSFQPTGATSWWIFDPVYFETTSSLPNVSLTGNQLSQITGAAYAAVATIPNTTYSGGITQGTVFDMLVGFMAGKVGFTAAGSILNTERPGENIYTYHAWDNRPLFKVFAGPTHGDRTTKGLTL